MSSLSADDRKVVVPPKWWEILPRAVYSRLDRVETGQPWFEVYRIDPEIYVIYEPGQFEEAISTLVLGEERAALIDTGCGIGDIKALAGEFTDFPVLVVIPTPTTTTSPRTTCSTRSPSTTTLSPGRPPRRATTTKTWPTSSPRA